MPNIIIEAVEISRENKIKLITELTDKASEITQIPKSSFSVIIKEFAIENWGIGGSPLEQILKS